jgi:hypothetical protein
VNGAQRAILVGAGIILLLLAIFGAMAATDTYSHTSGWLPLAAFLASVVCFFLAAGWRD